MRNIAVFTEQSSALQNHAKFKGWHLPVWHEHQDLWALKREGIELKADETPITAQIDKRIELYNLAQFDTASKSSSFVVPPPATMHSSFRSSQPYSKSFQSELQARAEALGIPESKYWLTSKEAAKHNLTLRSDLRAPTVIVARVSSKLYCSDQFNHPAKAAQLPVSGLSKRTFSGDMNNALRAIVEEKKYSTGLFFTPKQLDLMELRSLIKPGEEPAVLPLSLIRDQPHRSSSAQQQFSNGPITATYYCVADIVDFAGLMQELQRFPVEKPTNLVTGKPLPSEAADKASEFLAAKKYPVDSASARNYFVTAGDLKKRGLKLVAGAVGFEHRYERAGGGGSGGNGVGPTIEFFNADQLVGDAAFRVAGTKA